ncbi:MAG: hypothetical protein IT291_06215 [Deltaproteobacteria bacterium]|nr:hypothetical protein [Deltaproteobacteria bacterium]
MRKEISSKIFHTLMTSCLVALSLALLVPNALAQGTPVWQPVPIVTKAQRTAGLSGGEGMQQIYSLEISKSNPAIMYAGTDVFPIYKSSDSGVSWKYVGGEIDAAGGCRSIAINPTNPDLVVAACGPTKWFSGTSSGFYKTSDGGKNWAKVLKVKIDVYEKGGWVEWTSPATLYAGTQENGLWKSTNYGDTWTQVSLAELNNDSISMIRVHPDNADIVYIASATDSKLYKLTNSGTTIAQTGTGLPAATYYRVEILGNRDTNYTNDTVYVAVGTSGIYKSTNSGASFTPSNGTSPNNLPIGANKFRSLSVSPVNGRLYAALWTHQIYYYSSDGGSNWYRTTSYDEKNADGWVIGSLRQSGMEVNGEYWSKPFAPHPTLANVVLTSSGQVIVKSTDGGVNWRYSNTGRNQINVGWGIDYTDMNSIDFDPANSKRFSVHSMDNGTFVTDDGGVTFRSVNIPDRHATVYSSSGNLLNADGINATSGGRRGNVMVTTNGGWDNRQIIISRNIDQAVPTWTPLTETAKSYTYHNIRFHPQNANIVYAENFRFDNLQSSNAYVTLSKPVRAVYPDNGDTVYTLYPVGGTVARIERSDDRGKTWTRNTYANPSVQYADVPIGTSSTKIGKFAAKPGNRDVLYIPSSGFGLNIINGNQRSLKNSAAGITDFSGGWGLVAVDPKNANNIYVGIRREYGFSTGIYKSTDGGNTFANINGNLGTYFSVYYLNVNPVDSSVWMGTGGGGIWKLPVGGVDTTAPTAPTGLRVVP